MARRILLLCLALGAAGAASAIGGYLYIRSQLPTIRSLADYKPPQATKVYSDDGQLVANIAEERRTVVALDAIPQHVINAFLAAEDANFYKHQGLDYVGIMRAFVKNLRPGAHLQGASTITQQTVKALILGPERSLLRKLREAVLARQLEQFLTKDEILHLYLNQIYFGSGAYGVEEASQTYFAKSVRDLNVAEAALLASIPKNPSHYTIKANPTAARKRQHYVLAEMREHGWISQDAETRAKETPIVLPKKHDPYLGLAPHYAEHVKQLLIEKYGEDEVLHGGLKVFTGMHAASQAAAHRAIQQGVEDLARRQGWGGSVLRIEASKFERFRTILHEAFDDQLARVNELSETKAKSDGYIWDLSRVAKLDDLNDDKSVRRALTTRRLEEFTRVTALVSRVDTVTQTAWLDLGGVLGRIALKSVQWARPYSPAAWTATPKRISDVLDKGDLVVVDIGEISTKRTDSKQQRTIDVELIPPAKAQGALVAIDPSTRLVRALVGGYDPEPGGFNRAIAALRQPGSAFKPIVYTAGILHKVITPASICPDSPIVIQSAGQTWKPDNFEDGKYDGNITYRHALQRSKNTCSVKLLEKLGPQKAIEVARTLGIHAKLPNNLTLALGSGEVTPLELTNAYATLASGGLGGSPIFIRKVMNAEGRVLQDVKPALQQVIDEATAYIVTSLMQSVVEGGTASKALVLDRPLAGKTGTSNESRNVWFAGYAPNLVATVWVGFDDNSPLGSVTGGSIALPIWIRYMGAALANEPKRNFAVPGGIVIAKINPVTGDPDPYGVNEVFLAGTEPTEKSQILPDIFSLDDDMAPDHAE